MQHGLRATHRQRQRRERTERTLALYDHLSTMCYNCYGNGHTRNQCTERGIIACSRCFVVNRFTSSCNCEKADNNEFIGQVVRLAGERRRPLFYVDIQVMWKLVVAQISTGQGECTINHHLAKWLTELLEMDDIDDDARHIVVPITHRQKTHRLKCRIVRYQEVTIILGTEYLIKAGFTFTFDKIRLHENSVVLPDPKQIQYLYNVVPEGTPLRRFLRGHGGILQAPTPYEIEWQEETVEEPISDEEIPPLVDCIRLDIDRKDTEELDNL